MACVGASASFEGHTASVAFSFPIQDWNQILPAVQFYGVLCKTSGHNSTNAWRPHRVDRNFACFPRCLPVTCRRETCHERPGAGSATAPAEALLTMSAGHRRSERTHHGTPPQPQTLPETAGL